jgi:hypothetical protein
VIHALWVVPTLLVTALWAWWGVTTDYYVTLNDFWGLLIMAELLNPADPRSLHNGFFPIGYPVLLRLFGGGSVVAFAFMLSVAAAGLTLLQVGAFLAQRAGATLAAAGVVLAAVHPLFFQHAVTSSPDMPMTAALVSGVLLFIRALERDAPREAMAAGAIIGLAVLLRYHAGVVVAGVAVGGGLLWPSRWRLVLASCAVACAVGGVQVGLNLWAGVGPLQTSQAFNLYKLFNPVDWFHLPPANLSGSAWEVVQMNPGAFWEAYLGQVQSIWPLLGVSALAAVVAPASLRRSAIFLLVVLACYLPVQALGGSSRGPLPAVPLVVVGALLAASRLRQWPRGGPLTAAVAVLSVAMAAWLWVPANRDFLRAQEATRAASASAEALLRADGVRFAGEVYTDSGEFYFVSTRRARAGALHPLTPGGWLRVDLYGFDRAFPGFRLTTLEEFLADCRHYGVTHLALTPSAEAMVRGLGAATSPDTIPEGLRWVGQAGGLAVVALTGP